MSGKLYVVGTPIGNLGDMSPRAAAVLESVDFIAAEDTRVTAKLLNHFGIKKELLSYYEHNKIDKGAKILERIAAGENAAVVSDAGMPAISDPGEDLVRMAHQNGIAVESVPGPSALVTALAISGMPSGRFCFEGFLTVNKVGRKKRLAELKSETRTLIFYEAPHKLSATLNDMAEVFGDRPLAIVRELTKIHETVTHTTLKEASAFYRENTPRGEYVLILGGAAEEPPTEYSLSDAVKIAREQMEKGLSASVAAKFAASETGLKKGDIYRKLTESAENS